MSDPARDLIKATSVRGVEMLADEAILREFLELRPDHPAALTRLSQHLYRTGRLEEAATTVKRALELAPDFADAHNALGEIWLRLSKGEDALACFNRALELTPGHGVASLNLGRLLLDMGKNPQAAQSLLNAIRALPSDAPAHLAMAMSLTRLGKHAEAVNAYKIAVKGDPPTGDVLNNHGVALDGAGRKAEAITVLRAAVLVQPESWTAWDNLGNALLARGSARMAEACHRQAMALKPGNSATLSNLANALHRQGRMEESVGYYREAIAISPNSAKFHTNLALTLLVMGRYEEGWVEYEWRWHEHAGFPKYLKEKPWKGENLGDGTLLLQAEQGFGDTIQFVRYAPMLRQYAKRIVLVCQPELVRLIKSSAPGLDDVVAEGTPPPPFDKGMALLSVPGLLKAGIAPVPNTVPYLAPPPGAGFDLGPRTSRLRVGLVWAGRQTHGDDWNRSMPAHLLAPFFPIPGIQFFSLQKGEVAERIGRPQPQFVTDVGNRCQDFADTAAVIQQLDLVIAVDTSVAHLAGALGKPVWVMLPMIPDFRWRLEGTESPWYPSMRLFRRRPGDGWERVINEITQALRQTMQLLQDKVG